MKSSLLVGVILLSLAPMSLARAADYPSVACESAPYFSANSCNECFNGGEYPAGAKLESLYDTWTNPNTSEQVAKQQEQKYPFLVNLGGPATVWSSNPAEPTEFWQYTQDILWAGPVDAQEFTLDPGKEVRLFQSNLGAHWLLEKTDAPAGAPIGLGIFPVVYRDIDANGVESAPIEHRECVAYSSAVTPTEVTPTPPVTKVETGPESALILILALGIAAAIAYARQRTA